MAKAKMICPFSGKLCKECAIYRGRHYLLCFNKNYRGYVENSEQVGKVSTPLGSIPKLDKQLEIPARMPSAIDPFTVTMGDIRK